MSQSSFLSSISLIVIVVAGFAWIYKLCYRFTGQAINHIAGPPSNSWLYGNVVGYFHGEACVKDLEWQSKYGGAVRLVGPLGQNLLLLFDPKAVQYIIQTAGYRYFKHRERKALDYLIIGPGLVWADGHRHKLQRRFMAPGFGVPETKALLPIFAAGVSKLVSQWRDLVSDSVDQSAVVDIHLYSVRATLDMVGEAAFDYRFGAQDESDNVLAHAYKNMFFDSFGNITKHHVLFTYMLQFIPEKLMYWVLEHVPLAKLKHAKDTGDLAREISRGLLKEKREAHRRGLVGNHDIMSIVVKANASEDPKHLPPEVDQIAQLQTLILAGHETTANSITWILYELGRNPSIQDRMRAEIREVESKKKSRDDPWTWQELLESMPYLTAVVKEGLRFHNPAILLQRQAAEDDVIPLSKPIVSVKGEVLNEIPIQKGQKVMISIAGYNRDKDMFGEDANVFNPDRWLCTEERTKPIRGSIGVYANLMTFSGGPRSCIGWRFAILELHIILVEIISHFELSLTPEAHRIRRAIMGTMEPVLEGQLEKGTQLPMKIKPANRDED